MLDRKDQRSSPTSEILIGMPSSEDSVCTMPLRLERAAQRSAFQNASDLSPVDAGYEGNPRDIGSPAMPGFCFRRLVDTNGS